MSGLFVSTSLYALARKLGLAPASAEFMKQVGAAVEAIQLDQPVIFKPQEPRVFVPAAYTVARCALLGDVQINVNAGATVIAKARTLAAHAFRESKCDVWVTCDDDVEVSLDALTAMVSQCKKEPSIVVAPCLLRDSLTANIEPSSVEYETKAPSGGRLSRIQSGGFGCVAMSRDVLEAVHDASPGLCWTDVDGVSRRVLFRDELDGRGHWFTEDTAFFRRIPPRFGRWAVRTGETVHNGQRLDLATLEALVAN